MGRIERQKRELIIESNKRLLGEASYSGIIKKGDDICEIICKRKIAKYGSSGDVVKMIQHLLDSNGFNKEFKGGGMKSGCSKEYPSCDGIKFTGSLPKPKFCKDCDCNNKDYQTDNPIGDLKDIDIYEKDDNRLGDIFCEDLRDCVNKYIFVKNPTQTPDISGFLKCVSGKNGSFTDQPVKSGCVTSTGRSLCEIKPKKIGDGEMATAVMGYWYNPITKRCEQTRAGYAPFSQMGKCNECCRS